MLNLRRHTLRVLPLLLPLLVLRALLPTGYMPAYSGGELRLVICDAEVMRASHTGHAEHAGHAGHGGHGDTGDNPPPQPAGTDCPFAQAPAVALTPDYAALGVMTPATSPAPYTPTLELPPATGPPRSHGARAPPVSTKEA